MAEFKVGDVVVLKSIQLMDETTESNIKYNSGVCMTVTGIDNGKYGSPKGTVYCRWAHMDAYGVVEYKFADFNPEALESLKKIR